MLINREHLKAVNDRSLPEGREKWGATDNLDCNQEISLT